MPYVLYWQRKGTKTTKKNLNGQKTTQMPIHKLNTYKEYHSVCPLVGIGTLPPPLSPASVPLPPEPKGGGGGALACGWGAGGVPTDDWRKILAFCLLCGPIPWIFAFHTVYRRIKVSMHSVSTSHWTGNMNACWTQHKEETTEHQKIHKRDGVACYSISDDTVCAHLTHIVP